MTNIEELLDLIGQIPEKYVERSNIVHEDAFKALPCENCSNNPKNGGNGICNCILGQQTIY